MDFQWRKEWTAPSVVGAIAFGVGAGVGYAFSKYQDRLSRKVSDAIDEMGSDIAHLQARVEESGTKVLEAAWDIITNMPKDDEESEGKISRIHNSPESLVDIRSTHPSVAGTSNVFLGDAIDVNWDMNQEVATRVGKEIYIIHRDEFDDEEKGYNHTTLTYYAGDDVLTDERDVPLHNQSQVIGEGNLIFGKGTGDPHIVYIRNDKIESEMEIILDTGFYQVEVLGTELGEALSAQKPVLPKFRQE